MSQPGGATSAGGPQQTLKLSDLAEGVVQGAFLGLKTTLDALPSTHHAQRSKSLLKYIHVQKQKVLRLRILVQWANQALAVNACAKAWGVASSHSDAFRFAADHMAYLHDELLHLAVPAFDVHTAWEILTTGQYTRLPAIIDEICPPKPLSDLERIRAMNKLNFRILCFLEGVKLPKGMKVHSVSDGKAKLCSKGEYIAELTLAQAPHYLIQEINSIDGNFARNKTQKARPRSSGPSEGTQMNAFFVSHQKTHTRLLEEHKWWWRLMKLEILSASPKGAPLHPEHLEVLKQEIDIRMCMVQEATTVNALNHWKESKSLVAPSGSNVVIQKAEEIVSLEGVSNEKENILVDVADERKQRRIKMKKEQHRSPLTLVHEMVREISTRLLLSTVRKELCELVGKNCAWEKKLKLAVATHLKPGYRLYYWMDTPLVTESMLQGESTESHGPYLEIGADESGRVTMEHFPPISYDQGFCQEPHMLVSLDVEAVLLRAAAANSAVIMGALFDSLKCATTSSCSNKEVTIQSWEEMLLAGGSKEIGSPSIYLYDRAKLILKVHCHLLDGSLVLEAGNSISQQLSPQVVKKLSVEEDRVNQSWKQWSRDVPVDASANPAILAFDKVASRLWLISEQLYHLIHRDMGFELSHSAKKFAREWSPLTMEPVLLEKHMEQKSNCSISTGRQIQMPVQGLSLPKSFPQLKQPDHINTPSGIRNGSTAPDLRPIKDLSCYLKMNLDADKDSSGLSMAIVGVDTWGIPVKIVNCLSVPNHEQHNEKEEAHYPCVDRTDEVPVSGKIKPRKRIEKRRMSFEESETDVLRIKRPCRTISIDSLRENGSLLEDLHLSGILDSDDDILMAEPNRASPRRTEGESCSTPQEPPDPDLIAVQWCQRRLLWEHLVFQMTALNVPFLDEYEPGQSDSFCARIIGWQPLEMDLKSDTGSFPPQPPTQETFKANMCFGFIDLQSVHIQVALDSDVGRWSIRIRSCALVHACRSGLKCKFKGVRLRIDEDIVELEYSASGGATVAHALQDLLRLAHTQEFVAALRKTVRDSRSAFEDSLAWNWPGCCSVQVDELGLSHVTFRVDQCGGLRDKYRHSTPRNGSNRCDLGTSVIYRVEFLPNFLKEDKTNPSHLDSIGCDSRKRILNNFIGLGNSQRVVCHLISIPSFPTDFLRELCRMIEAREPGLFLDAIATVSGSLLTIGQALSPSNFQAAKLSPGLLSLAPSDPPYCFKLLFAKGEKNVAMDVRLFSNGVSYFGIHQPRIGGGDSPQGMSSLQNNGSDGGDEVSSVTLDMVQVLQRFAERVKDFPGVQVSHRLPGDGFRGSKLAGFGLWCQRRVMPKILKEYIGCVAHR